VRLYIERTGIVERERERERERRRDELEEIEHYYLGTIVRLFSCESRETKFSRIAVIDNSISGRYLRYSDFSEAVL